MTGDQGKDLVYAGIQHPDIGWTYYLGGHDAITVLAEQRGERNDVVLPDVSQRPEKRVAVPGNANVPRLSRKRRAGNMASRAAQSESVHAFDDDYREAETRNLNAAKQAAGHGRRRGFRRSGGRNATSCAARFLPVMQQLFEVAALPLLVEPAVRQNQPAITQHQDAGGAE